MAHSTSATSHHQRYVVIGESRLTAAPFFEGAGRPSGPFWGPQQGRRVILWESLSLEDQQKCLIDLQDDTEWVIWCKAKPKDMATQAFRAYGQCIFEGKRFYAEMGMMFTERSRSICKFFTPKSTQVCAVPERGNQGQTQHKGTAAGSIGFFNLFYYYSKLTGNRVSLFSFHRFHQN